jgi:hypothetical protein
MGHDDDPIFKVLCRFETYGVQTDFQLLVLEDPYSTSISGPDLLTTVHWRMADIGRAVSRKESEITKLIEFKVVETTAEQAMEDHLKVCKKCGKEWCFPGDRLRQRLGELANAYK